MCAKTRAAKVYGMNSAKKMFFECEPYSSTSLGVGRWAWQGSGRRAEGAWRRKVLEKWRANLLPTFWASEYSSAPGSLISHRHLSRSTFYIFPVSPPISSIYIIFFMGLGGERWFTAASICGNHI